MSKYTVQSKEFGRGPASVKRFSSLRDVQAYVKTQWQGAEYLDGSDAFHTDYCTFRLTGCTLRELGARAGEYGTDEYWQWVWIEMNPAVLARQALWRCTITSHQHNSELDYTTFYADCKVDGCGQHFSFVRGGDDGFDGIEMEDCGRHREVPVVVSGAGDDIESVDSEEVPF